MLAHQIVNVAKYVSMYWITIANTINVVKHITNVAKHITNVAQFISRTILSFINETYMRFIPIIFRLSSHMN